MKTEFTVVWPSGDLSISFDLDESSQELIDRLRDPFKFHETFIRLTSSVVSLKDAAIVRWKQKEE